MCRLGSSISKCANVFAKNQSPLSAVLSVNWENCFIWRCASVIVNLRHSSGHQKLARKEGTDWPDSVHRPTWDTRVTIVQDDGYWRFQTEVELNVAYCCSKFNLYCLLSCRDKIRSWIPLPSHCDLASRSTSSKQTTMSIYPMHKSTFMPSLNAIAQLFSEILLFKYKLKHWSTLRRIVTLSEGHSHRTKNR